MSNLTPDEPARLRLTAKHGTLTPEEKRAYNDYVTEQLSAVPSPPSGAVPPKKDKPKRNIDAIDVVRKIAGVAVIVVALALLGPKLLGFGTDLLGDAMNFTTAVHDAADAQPTSVIKQQVKLRMERLRDKQTIEDLGDGTILFLPEHQ